MTGRLLPKRAGTLRLTGLALALLAASCGADSNDVEEGAGTVARYGQGPKPGGVSTPDDAVTTTYYIPHAAISDVYEITAAEIALARAESPDVRQFAQTMLADHGQTSQALTRFVNENPVNIAIPQMLDRRRKAMIDNLEAASDEDFDSIYIRQQAADHQEAYNLHQSFANNGADRKLAELAGRAAEIVDRHRQRLEQLVQQVTGPG